MILYGPRSHRVVLLGAFHAMCQSAVARQQGGRERERERESLLGREVCIRKLCDTSGCVLRLAVQSGWMGATRLWGNLCKDTTCSRQLLFGLGVQMEYPEKSCILASVVLTSQGFNQCNNTYDVHHVAMGVIVANKLSLSPPFPRNARWGDRHSQI
jgi:hypothetical protein